MPKCNCLVINFRSIYIYVHRCIHVCINNTPGSVCIYVYKYLSSPYQSLAAFNSNHQSSPWPKSMSLVHEITYYLRINTNCLSNWIIKLNIGYLVLIYCYVEHNDNKPFRVWVYKRDWGKITHYFICEIGKVSVSNVENFSLDSLIFQKF